MCNICDGYQSWQCVNAHQNCKGDAIHYKKIILRISPREVTAGQ